MHHLSVAAVSCRLGWRVPQFSQKDGCGFKGTQGPKTSQPPRPDGREPESIRLGVLTVCPPWVPASSLAPLCALRILDRKLES